MAKTLELKSVNGEVLKISVKADAIVPTGGTYVTNASSLGGEAIYAQKNGQVLEFKGLVAGSNITLTPSATGITISSIGGGSSSGVTNAEFQQYTGVTAPATFANKTTFNDYTGNTSNLINGLDADISYLSGQTSNKVNTSLFNSYTGSTAPIINEAVTGGSSLGGIAIFSDKTGRNLRFKGLVAGDGITLTPSSTGVTVSANVTGITGYVTEVEFNAYTGATETILNGLDADITYLSGQTNLKVNTTLFNTYTGATATALSGINTELDLAVTGATQLGGINLFAQKTGRNLDFKGLVAGTNITITPSSTGVTISSSGGGGGGGAYLPISGGTVTGATNFSAGANIYGDIVSLTGTTTLDASHAGKIIECNGTFTVTLPNSMVSSMKVTIINVGTGVITIAASTTLQSKFSNTKLGAQYAAASAYHAGSNVWRLFGDLNA